MTDRHVCPPDHKHDATATCRTKHGCRCDDCRALAASEARYRRHQIARGTWQPAMQDAAPVLERVELLFSLGYTFRQLQVVTCVHASTLTRLRNGKTTIRRDIARAIMRAPIVAPGPSSEYARVPSRGFYRRMHALASLGWSGGELARRLDVHGSVPLRERECVTAGTYDRGAALFDELWDRLPPRETPTQAYTADRTIAMARARGWLPPLAWDDIDTDESPAVVERDTSVDEIAVALAVEGQPVRLTPAERRLVISELHGRRYSDSLIAEHLGVWTETVQRIRADELHLPALTKSESLHFNRAA